MLRLCRWVAAASACGLETHKGLSRTNRTVPQPVAHRCGAAVGNKAFFIITTRLIPGHLMDILVPQVGVLQHIFPSQLCTSDTSLPNEAAPTSHLIRFHCR